MWTKSKSQYFTEEQFEALDPERLPKHIAIIPDGNRRWAQRQMEKGQAERENGHTKGAYALADIVKACSDLGIRTMTLYLFSTENWSRPQEEVKAFLFLLQHFLQQQLPTMLENGVRFHTIGDLSRLPSETAKAIQEIKDKTSAGTEFDLIAAINYGSRSEITRAFQHLLEDYKKGIVNPDEISEELISQYLDTAPWPDPDLLIRTSGENRISNFLLWQICYAEFYTSDVLWPDFSPKHLFEALHDFQLRRRRRGE